MRSPADRLDAIFAEIEELQSQMLPLRKELYGIDYTKTGRFRYKLTDRQLARREEVERQLSEPQARLAELSAAAAHIVKDYQSSRSVD